MFFFLFFFSLLFLHLKEFTFSSCLLDRSCIKERQRQGAILSRNDVWIPLVATLYHDEMQINCHWKCWMCKGRNLGNIHGNKIMIQFIIQHVWPVLWKLGNERWHWVLFRKLIASIKMHFCYLESILESARTKKSFLINHQRVKLSESIVTWTCQACLLESLKRSDQMLAANSLDTLEREMIIKSGWNCNHQMSSYLCESKDQLSYAFTLDEDSID